MALFPIVILAVFIGMWLARRGSTLTRDCRWRQEGRGPEGVRFRCAACGAECVLAKGPPRDCLRPPEP